MRVSGERFRTSREEVTNKRPSAVHPAPQKRPRCLFRTLHGTPTLVLLDTTRPAPSPVAPSALHVPYQLFARLGSLSRGLCSHAARSQRTLTCCLSRVQPSFMTLTTTWNTSSILKFTNKSKVTK